MRCGKQYLFNFEIWYTTMGIVLLCNLFVPLIITLPQAWKQYGTCHMIIMDMRMQRVQQVLSYKSYLF